jgi:hypothetical protein
VADETDAIAIVVSEETGRISMVTGDELAEDLDGPRLREELLSLTGHTRLDGQQEEGSVEGVSLPVGSETR